MSSNPTNITLTVTDNQPTYKKANNNQSLASAVMSQIEDGNMRAAIRNITSGDSPAVVNIQT